MNIFFAVLFLGSVKIFDCRPQSDSTIISYENDPLHDGSNGEQLYKYR